MAKRGRPTKTQSVLNSLKSQPEKKTPIASGMFIPNLSGDHSAGHTGTPVNDTDIANKKYVDDEIIAAAITDYWKTTTNQTGLTGDKTGSFDLTTTGALEANSLDASGVIEGQNIYIIGGLIGLKSGENATDAIRLEESSDDGMVRFYDQSPQITGTIKHDGTNLNIVADVGDIILNPTGDIKTTADNKKLYFGAGDDAEIYYDGTDLHIKPQEVGSGAVKITGTGSDASGNCDLYITETASGTVGAGITLDSTAAGGRKYAFLSNDSGGQLLIYDGKNDAYVLECNYEAYWASVIKGNSNVGCGIRLVNIGQGSDWGIIARAGDDLGIYDETQNDYRLNIDSSGNVKIPNDNAKLTWGAGNDAGIWYDGSHLHIDAQLVGSGNIILDNLPTSDPSVAGALWSDSGTIKISAG